jgi:NADPH:quinone reductase-like Zn-dependent oxidoreductase
LPASLRLGVRQAQLPDGAGELHIQGGQFPAISPYDFFFHDLSLHGFWLINWIRSAPRTEIQETYQKLGDLVADGSLSAAVEHVYPLEQFKEAFEQSLRSNRSGKVLFGNVIAHVSTEPREALS